MGKQLGRFHVMTGGMGRFLPNSTLRLDAKDLFLPARKAHGGGK